MIVGRKLIVWCTIFCLYTAAVMASRPLRILFVVEYFPARSQPHIINLMIGLIDKGHQVSIFAFRKGDVTDVHPQIEKYGLLDRVYYKDFPTKLSKVDIVFCQSATLGKKILSVSSLKKWVAKRKLVISLRGADITKNSVRENPALYSQLFKHSNLFLPVCDYFKRVAVELGCAAEKITVHHSAIDCSLFAFKERQKSNSDIIQLASVCRLVEKKGLTFAIQAVADVVQRYPKLHYTIVGDGPERGSLEQLVKELGLAEYITFTGWLIPDRVVALLDASHIFLLPSITAVDGDEEGIANALKEAMAMGLITIGTWHAGTPELIDDGVSGFLVAEKSSEQLADTIKYIIRHPKKWKSVSRAARKKIEDEFETKQSVNQLEEIFYHLLGLQKNN